LGIYTESNPQLKRRIMSDRLIERFLEYARIRTTSDPSSKSSPSSSFQTDFLKMLEEELREMGMADVELDPAGTLYASLPGTGSGSTVIGLLAHVDTAPDSPGENVSPVLHGDWDGRKIELSEGVVVDPADTEDMHRYLGDNIITSDGTTLLGADDKAGVAIIMELLSMLMSDSEIPRPPLRVAFTTDEEVGRGMDGFSPERFGAQLAYTVDGGPVGQIDTQTFNAFSATWSVAGNEVHPGSAGGLMVNATRIVADIVSMMRPEEMPENSYGTDGYDYPVSIESATASGRLSVMLRDFTSEGIESRVQRMRELEKYISAKYPKAVIELELKEQYRNPSNILKEDRRLVDFALRGSSAAGVEGRETSVRGGTDGSRLSFMGIPTVNLPTGGELYHSRKEWIADRGMRISLETLKQTLAIWAEED